MEDGLENKTDGKENEMMETTLSKFYALMLSAQSAVDEVDDFDLNSKDENSVSDFENLTKIANKECAALVSFVQAHANELMTFLERHS